jgi:hypothetical protein
VAAVGSMTCQVRLGPLFRHSWRGSPGRCDAGSVVVRAVLSLATITAASLG